jgi:hypothetical protein
MVPMKLSTIFKSRWWALLWAAGIIYFAMDFVGEAPAENASNQAAPVTDVTGAEVRPEDVEALKKSLEGL